MSPIHTNVMLKLIITVPAWRSLETLSSRKRNGKTQNILRACFYIDHDLLAQKHSHEH